MQAPCPNPRPAAATEDLPLFAWFTRVRRTGDGRAEIEAVRPLKNLTAQQAGEILGMAGHEVRRLWKAGIIAGSKPGAIATRSDGRANNARIVLDAGSVMAYKASISRPAMF